MNPTTTEPKTEAGAFVEVPRRSFLTRIAQRAMGASFTSVFATFLFASAASADDITITPTAAGAPGGAAIPQLLNWIGQYGLFAAAGGMIMGGGMYAYSKNQGGAVAGSTGQKMILGAAVGAFVIGLSGTAIGLMQGLGATG